MQCILVLVIVLSLAAVTLAAIHPIDDHGADNLKVRGESFRTSSHDVLRQLRAAGIPKGIPTAHRAALNDSNFRAIIQYSGSDSKVIFVLTYDNDNVLPSTNLYRSSDYGFTFSNINNRISNSLLYPNIYVSPEDYKTIIVAHATDSSFFISTDEGATFTHRTLTTSDGGTINPRSLLFHPTKESWFLAHDTTHNKLYLSKDLGASPLAFISGNVVSVTDYQWGEAPYDNDDVFYYNTDDPSDDSVEVHLYKQQYPFTSDSATEFDTNLGAHDSFLLLDRYIFAQKTVNGKAMLWISYDRKNFKQALIPSNVGHENYRVASIKSVQALVIVEHSDGVFNLYTSDETGQYFSLSLNDITITKNGNSWFIDLEIVDSSNSTVFIANQNVDTGSGSSTDTAHTLISFDVGGNWEAIRSPEYDSQNNPLNCVLPSCSLHFHMSNSEYWRTGVYSQESAPGIIIAHGATGATLNDDDTNLYISRDGGATWHETLKSTWGVSVLDHGGLLVAAQDYHAFIDSPSSVLSYSCDEGTTWTNFTFSDKNTIVFGVITEPGETTTVVSLYGIDNTSTYEWVVIVVNFTNIYDRVCNDNDYYDWTPFDERTETGCLLGASVTIERRIPDRCCLNGHKYDREVSYSVCACTEEDFECDYGYKHADGFEGDCIRDSSVTLSVQCTGNDVQTYIQSQGYRKIGGDVCKGGVESNYASVELPCCDSGASSSKITIILGAVLLLAVVIIIVLTVALIIITVKYVRAKQERGGYHQAPRTEQVLYFRSDSPSEELPGIQDQDGGTEDDPPLLS